MRFTAGYEPGGLPSHFQTVARNEFLRDVETLAPEVLDDLQAATTPDDLDRWARRWNLRAEWITHRAIATREYWREFPTMAGSWTPAQSLVWRAPAPSPFVVSPGYDPEEEDRTVARKRILESVEPYLDAQEARARAAGAVAIPKRPQLLDHVRWLVRFQVCGWPYARIQADARAGSRRTVELGVRNAAAMVGLDLRPPKHGPARTPMPTTRALDQNPGVHAIVIASAARLLRKEIVAVQKAAVKYAADADAFTRWVMKFYLGHSVLVRQTLQIAPAAADGYCSRQAQQILTGAGWVAALELWRTPSYAASLATWALDAAHKPRNS